MSDPPRLAPKAINVPAVAGVTSARDLAEARLLLSAIVDSSDDAILAKDLDGIITSWNAGASRIYGYTAEEILGQSVAVLIPPEAEDDLPRLMARLRQGERIGHFETVRIHKDGQRIHVSLSISPIRDVSGAVIGASTIARDITARKREEARRRVLSEIAVTLAGVLDGEQVLRDLARLVVREWADYCITYLLEDDRIRRVGAAHADPDQEPLVQRLVELAPPTLRDAMGPGAVLRDGEPILATDIPPSLLERAAGGGEYLRALQALGPVSSLVLPLQARGRTVGAIAFATTARSNRRYTEEDLALGRDLASRAALALDNARLYSEAQLELERRKSVEDALRRRYQQLRVLYRMTEAVAGADALEAIYEAALDGLRRTVGVDRASILLFDADGVMRFKAWRGLSDEYRRAVDGHSPWRPDVRDPNPVVVADVSASVELSPELRAIILGEGIRAMAFIPLVFDGRLLGKFMLYFDTPHAVDAEELELARTVAGTIALAIVRMRDEQRVREAKEAAERASEAKSQFVGIMSHELRTPLNAVLGYADLLLLEVKGKLTEGQRAQVERIQASAQHQLGLVDELLTYTRLEAGREEPRLIETDARRVIADVAELVRPEADAKGLALRLDLPDEPLQIRTDPAKLRQIALNLVGNAAKYTDRGEVAIRARQRRRHFVFEVRDTGAGIPADKLEYIFEPFAQVDQSRTRMNTGTGLGLAIARRFAALLGGSLEVRSRLGAGSTFTLRLPANHRPTAPDPPPE